MSYIDLQNTPPQDPLTILAQARLQGTQGVYLNSSTFGTPTGPWIASPFAINAVPTCQALGVDNILSMREAEQWNFQHLTWNSSTNLAIPMRKVIFLRGGIQWAMTIQINFGALNYPDIQLSFRDNAATRGDFAGTIPVISFTGMNYTGNTSLEVTLKQLGRVTMGMRAINAAGDYSMFEMEWIIVP